MRCNYRVYPTEYVNELYMQGKRKKARAFFEYWHDFEMDEVNSIGFYAKSWEVSKSTAHAWVREFKYEVDRFLNAWQFRNDRHYEKIQKVSSRQNSSRTPAERLPNEKNATKAPKNRTFEESAKTPAERLPNQEYNNIYDDDNKGAMHFDQTFNDLYFTYSVNTKFKGKKEEAYKEWVKVKSKIDPKLLKQAIVSYLHDGEVNKRYNFANFLKNEVYLAYMPKRFKIKIDGVWVDGNYDEEREAFTTQDGKEFTLRKGRIPQLYKENRLEFVV